MDDARNITKDGQKDVDKEVCTTTPFKEHTDRWQYDGKEDLADIRSGEGHWGCYFGISDLLGWSEQGVTVKRWLLIYCGQY